MQELKSLLWEDYRYVLAIARADGATKAAEQLGVNVSTAFRRLEKIEHAIQTVLFDRSRKGYVLTEAGREVVRAAEIMEQAAFAADRIVTGHDQQLTGEVRITATEALASCFLPRHVKSFQDIHPDLTVTIISENRVLSLAEREADIALRPRRPSDETLIGRKIATFRWGVYGSAELVDDLGPVKRPKDLKGHHFIAWSGTPLAEQFDEWLSRSIPDVKLACRSSNLITNAQLASNSVGLTLLPCLVGGAWPGLKPVLAPLSGSGANREIWLAIHEDMRHNARVRALIDHIVEAARRETALFEGGAQIA